MSERQDIERAYAKNINVGKCEDCDKWKALAGELLEALEIVLPIIRPQGGFEWQKVVQALAKAHEAGCE